MDARRELLRTAGLGNFGTPQLDDVNRRRAQLWVLSLGVGFVIPIIIIALSMDILPDGLQDAFDRRAVQLGFVALLVTLFGYVAEREVALRKLTRQIFDEHQSMQATVEAFWELDRVKDDFLAMITHELRNPLTSIVGILATLERHAHELDRDQLQELARTARNQSGRLDRLVSDLLETATLQHGTAPLTPSHVDVPALTSEVVARVARNAVEHSVNLDLPVEEVTRHVDKDTLTRILINLVGNAIKHTPPGTAIDVAVRAVERGVEITVSDDGPGIAETSRETIFEKFQRGETSATDGLGLGLHIVRGLSEAHGGSVHLEPQTHGARFVVTLAELTDRAPVPA
jgi:two-component system, OmpR family, sensor histidine kinase KdpD